jgi:predicted dinucleotide-binding enzyme
MTVQNKVIVDPTNPVAPDGNGGFQKIIGEQESSGQILAGLLSAGARLVKAFGRSKNSAGGSHVQHGAARSQQEART